jgi:hypothetical protein
LGAGGVHFVVKEENLPQTLKGRVGGNKTGCADGIRNYLKIRADSKKSLRI